MIVIYSVLIGIISLHGVALVIRQRGKLAGVKTKVASYVAPA